MQFSWCVDLLFIVAPIVCECSVFLSLFCYAVPSVPSSSAIILIEKREIVALL